jgi:CheY-like chemotaxis protein
MAGEKTLLSVVELGGYPNFTTLYQQYGYRVESITSGRKAISRLKQGGLDVVVAEFNYQTEFRDRTSALESILATLQGRAEVKVIVLYAPADQAQLDKLRARFPGFIALPLPVTAEAMESALQGLAQ